MENKQMTNVMAIEIMRMFALTLEDSELYDALEFVIKEAELNIETPVNRHGKWASADCPNCGGNVSKHHGDGYYSDDFELDRCHKCGQLISWE